MENQRVDSDIGWNVRFLRADDRTGDFEDLVLNVVQDQLFVLAFCGFSKEILLKRFLVCADRASGEIEQFSQSGRSIVS